MSLGLCRRCSASLWGLLLAVLVFPSSPAVGASIFSVAPSPSAPIDGDFVSLVAHLEYETTGFETFEILTTALGPTEFQIDIHVSSPGPGEAVLYVFTSEDVNAGLGYLSAGHYSYLVNLILYPRTTGQTILADSVSGSFTVTGAPEPDALALLGCGLLALSFARGISSKRPFGRVSGSRGDRKAK
jgi:hypothetical protein